MIGGNFIEKYDEQIRKAITEDIIQNVITTPSKVIELLINDA